MARYIGWNCYLAVPEGITRWPWCDLLKRMPESEDVADFRALARLGFGRFCRISDCYCVQQFIAFGEGKFVKEKFTFIGFQEGYGTSEAAGAEPKGGGDKGRCRGG